MITSKDFRLDFVRVVAFTPDQSAFVSGKAVASILGKFQDVFDGEMQVLPIPNEVSGDVPRAILQNQDSTRLVTMSPTRVDAIWNLRQAEQSTLSVAEAVAGCAGIVAHYASQMGLNVNRVALLVQRFCAVANPAQSLAARFCNAESQKEPFNRSASFEIHNHKEYVMKRDGEQRINSWVRCKSGRTPDNSEPAILVEQDLNTLATASDARFETSKLPEFFAHASAEAEEILGKYFPG